jgi:hypothetical protein
VRRVAQALSSLALAMNRVPRPSRSVRRAGTTKACGDDLMLPDPETTWCRQHRTRPCRKRKDGAPTILEREGKTRKGGPPASGQLNTASQAISQFKQNVPNYTTQMQCTSAALSIAAKAGVSLPRGVGPVAARESRTVAGHQIGVTLWKGNVANPYTLNQQMTAAHGAPTVVNASSFPIP